MTGPRATSSPTSVAERAEPICEPESGPTGGVPDGPRPGRVPTGRFRLGAAGAGLLAGLAAAAAAWALGAGIQGPPSAPLPAGPSELYAREAAAPLERLDRSLRAVGGAIDRVAGPGDLATLRARARGPARTLGQLREDAAGLPVGQIDEDAQARLLEALSAYEVALLGLARIDLDDAAAARAAIPVITEDARLAADKLSDFEERTGLAGDLPRRLPSLEPVDAALAESAELAAHITILGDSAIGAFSVGSDSSGDGTLASAMAAFGPTDGRSPDGYQGCNVIWTSLGLEIYFYNLGGLDPCSDAGGLFGSAQITGPRFATDRGVRIGTSEAELRLSYPNAQSTDGDYSLDQTYLPYGDGGLSNTLIATIGADGTVSRLVLSYPSGGE